MTSKVSKCRFFECPNFKELLIHQKLVQNLKTEMGILQEELTKSKEKNTETLISFLETMDGQPKTTSSTALSAEFTKGKYSFQSCIRCKNTSFVSVERKELLEKIRILERKTQELEADNKEAKENIEFIQSEMTIMSEALKEAEDNFAKERKKRTEEASSIHELGTRSTKLYQKVIQKE